MNQYYPDRVLTIPNTTPETTDAAQYMIYKGRKQFNLCGEFCVAYCMQDEAHTDSIDDFLNYWEAQSLKWYQTLFRDKLARTTGVYDLQKMLDAYGAEYYPLTNIKRDPLLWELELEHAQLIIGVQIDYGGYLVGKGIPHWVALDHMLTLDADHAILDIYNPFTNAMEPYTWREVMNSSGAYKQGLWVRR